MLDDSLNNLAIRLIESSIHTRGPYVCLSHCWGHDGHPLTTKIGTLAIRKESIPFDDLPSLFADAVQITRSLGYRYIWIDSLCILQDSVEDWDRESKMMASVYSNSLITIAAVSASSSLGRCSYQNPPNVAEADKSRELQRFQDHEITVSVNDGRQCHVYCRPRYDHWYSFPDEDFPLLGRGWVYQERVLSPRMVYFGRRELFWECNQTTTCQCSGIDDRQIKGSWAKHKNGSLYYYDWHDPIQASQQWQLRVRTYSELALTKSSDKLPAIRGIATQMSKYFKCRYLDGLWESSLLYDLLWTSYVGSAYKPGIGGFLRPTDRLAPSWSWASIEDKIRFETAYIVSPLIQIISIHPQEHLTAELPGPQAGRLCVSGYISAGTLTLFKDESAQSSNDIDELSDDVNADPDEISDDSSETFDGICLRYQPLSTGNENLHCIDIPSDIVWPDYAWRMPGPDIICDQTTLHFFRIAQAYEHMAKKDYAWVVRKLHSSEPLYQRIGLVCLPVQEPPHTLTPDEELKYIEWYKVMLGIAIDRASHEHNAELPRQASTGNVASEMPIDWERKTITII